MVVMYSIQLLAFLVCSLASVAVSTSFHAREATISQRDDLLDEYDFIIIGAGTAGLTVGDRLSEDGKSSVLVVEYGYNDTSFSIREVQNAFAVLPDFPPDPGATPDEFPAATRMYNTTSVPLPGLNNRTQPGPAGSVVGGSSAVNGMVFDRGSEEDYDSWVVSAGAEHAAEYGKEWGWNNILPSFKKSVTFQPPTPFMVENYNMTSDVAAAYGGHTAIHSSYPPFQWPGLFPTRKALGTVPGVEFPIEGADGNAVGVFFFPNSIVPNIRKRSYALTGHYLDKDGPVTRSNFHLLPAHRVTQVLLSQLQDKAGDEPSWQAEEVVITPRDGPLDITRIKARKEIIISAGSLHTPQVLQRSGIGPRSVLTSANVPVKIDLPGVGENLQDHPFFAVSFNYTSVLPDRNTLGTNATFRAAATELWDTNRTGPYSSFPSHGGFLPLSVISNRTEAIVDALLAQDPATFFPTGTDPTVIAGYEVRRNASAQQLLGTKSAVLEVPFDGASSFSLILLKEQSRGTVFIAPNDDGTGRGSVEPVIDFRTFQNPVDIQLSLEMIRFWREFHASPAMQEVFAPVEVSPGPDLVSDEDLTEFLRENSLSSNGHPIGTAALGPRELGGVVRPDLTVHGTVGLSVADNSIMPLIPGTHTSSTAYAIGEKASLLIMSRNS